MAAMGVGRDDGDCCFEDPDKQKYKTDPATAALPPGPPADAAPDGEEAVIQAFSRIFLGDTDRHGVASPDAWKEYGFDLDGLTSDATNTYHCKAVEGGKKKDIRVDGKGGIDNSFGKNILRALIPQPSAQANEKIKQGTISLVLRVDKLGAKVNYTGVQGQVSTAQGAIFETGEIIPPTADQLAAGTYTWQPFPETVFHAAAFTGSYLAGNTLVSSVTPGDFSLLIPFGGLELPLQIHHGWLLVKLSDDHRSGTEGTIGGLLDPQELILSLKQFGGTISTTLCDSKTFEELAAQIRQASDSMNDGTQDPTQTCDGISVGLGFESSAALLGGTSVIEPPSYPPCP